MNGYKLVKFRTRADNGNLVFYITKYLPIKSSASQMIEPRIRRMHTSKLPNT